MDNVLLMYPRIEPGVMHEAMRVVKSNRVDDETDLEMEHENMKWRRSRRPCRTEEFENRVGKVNLNGAGCYILYAL